MIKTYTCEQCHASIAESDIFKTEYPDILDEKMLDFVKKYEKENNGKTLKICGQEVVLCYDREKKFYHKYVHRSTTRHPYICNCGPLHEETDAEYYVRWATNK